MKFNDRKSIFLQIADYFFENILLRKLQFNDRLPSVRELAISLEVNPNTVMRTYQHLQEKQIIYNKRGIGYFVDEEAYSKALSIKKEAFLSEDLPLFFKTLDLLKLTIDDIKKYKNENK